MTDKRDIVFTSEIDVSVHWGTKDPRVPLHFLEKRRQDFIFSGFTIFPAVFSRTSLFVGESVV